MIIDFIVLNAIFRAELLELVAQHHSASRVHLEKVVAKTSAWTRFVILPLKIVLKTHTIYSHKA